MNATPEQLDTERQERIHAHRLRLTRLNDRATARDPACIPLLCAELRRLYAALRAIAEGGWTRHYELMGGEEADASDFAAWILEEGGACQNAPSTHSGDRQGTPPPPPLAPDIPRLREALREELGIEFEVGAKDRGEL